jgi:predicted ATPase
MVSDGIAKCIVIGRLEFFRFATPQMINLMYEEFTSASYQDLGEIMAEYNENVQWEGYKNNVKRDIHQTIRKNNNNF